jgi:hypothetical protein
LNTKSNNLFGIMPASRLILCLLVIGSSTGCNKEQPKNDSRFEVPAAGYPVSVEPSGSENVDALVRQLVSQRPAPYRSGYSDPPSAVVFGSYITPEVAAAMKGLKALGPIVFPALAKHMGDDRYSYSGVVAAWLNYTVGDAVVEVLCDGHYMHSGYKGRETPLGGAGYLSFGDYLEDRGYEAWPQWAKTRTRLEIQIDFIDWCIAEEEKRGFIDEDQRKHVLDTYASARDRVRNEYSEPHGAGSQMIRSETNSTLSPAGSPR